MPQQPAPSPPPDPLLAISRPCNALSVDVEDYFHAEALASRVPRESWATREYRVEQNTDRILKLLSETDIKGTFFVLGWVAERSPDLVRRISKEGHEVACHGYSHRLIYRQTPEEFRQESARAKALLEDICGQRVGGYRAASFSITRASLWALDILIDLGFDYDSSVFPIRHDRYGIPGASSRPGPIDAPSGRRIAEFPLTVANFLGLRVPVSGGGYFRIFPYWLTHAGLKQINRAERRPFIFYLHPWELDDDQPRVGVRGFARLRHYTNLRACQKRLTRLLNDFTFAPAASVLQQYS